ncbi:cold-regulated 413 inner membrane protein 1, chloroplastic [Sorghum bicolor]|uniref:Uncharacterized protein n=1 Tax=Sorghum bicolor TaxID=4558 RepID=A0A1W0VYT8_SORBI|nr:cold-regulated 413 inner membrane protein 1, chloroplastic [Sorghum bicolor]XP_021312894.1 cold-regulated 413 inner membrane protein 1, chloroplastic [Sorghum bicolor]XP_021312895.1 cold-regulated 413 inner membrane protein 1, chloroplastic [Sorghum bicolor]OQU87279.1 hypothetical protein SORBI_3003G247800 [Sorghum bicolor]OQU87280.1 hypothetical protein SORBI_3003G247800 [Sorghum bicolor]OQU87281.1 hypothetical protein SORBI_3003G247800 [Sorghum bicolor]OQU87282.1 hypothetical protein SOR|eukprot:XP_021312893.1 cold-regulated 413 inner membrane protein 1, chloroplastic [Sorghum bicolor]
MGGNCSVLMGDERCAMASLRSSSAALMPWCRRLGDNAIVCCTPAHLSAETMQLISVMAAATLMLATGTSIRKPLLVPLFALRAPSSVVLWLRDDYGRWTAFLGGLLRLLYFIPGELELPLSTVLLVTCAPYQFIMNLRKSQGAAILAAATAGYLMFQHFTRMRCFRKAFDRESIIATSSIICMTVTSLTLVF